MTTPPVKLITTLARIFKSRSAKHLRKVAYFSRYIYVTVELSFVCLSSSVMDELWLNGTVRDKV